MTRRDFPLWFRSDVIAFIGVMATYWTLITINEWVHRRVISRATRHLSKLEFALLANILPIAESWLAWTLQRQALRANGRDADTAKPPHISPPTTLAAFKIRCRRYVDDVADIDAPARKAAQNLARVVSAGNLPSRQDLSSRKRAALSGTHFATPAASQWIPALRFAAAGMTSCGNLAAKRARAPPHIRRTTYIRQMPQKPRLLRSRAFLRHASCPAPPPHDKPRPWSGVRCATPMGTDRCSASMSSSCRSITPSPRCARPS